MPATPPPDLPQISISRLPTEILHVPIIGTAPYIAHRFAEKARKQMLDNMQGNRAPKEHKDPQAEFEAARYRTDTGGDGCPILAFKSATISGARYYPKNVSMVLLRQTLFFAGEQSKQGDILNEIHYAGEPNPVMREDVATVGMKGHDLRYRPMYVDWSTMLHITYVTSMLTRDSVLSLVEAGGMGVGVGDWRPEKSGQFGTYRIDPTKDIDTEIPAA